MEYIYYNRQFLAQTYLALIIAVRARPRAVSGATASAVRPAIRFSKTLLCPF